MLVVIIVIVTHSSTSNNHNRNTIAEHVLVEAPRKEGLQALAVVDGLNIIYIYIYIYTIIVYL